MSNEIYVQQATQAEACVAGGLVCELLKELFPDQYGTLDRESVEESARKVIDQTRAEVILRLVRLTSQDGSVR
jgi:hypothetical protein